MKNHIYQNETSAQCLMQFRETQHITAPFFPAELTIKIPSLVVYTKARHREKCTKYDISPTGVINGINAAVKDPLKIKASLSPICGILPKSQIFSYLSAFFPL